VAIYIPARRGGVVALLWLFRHRIGRGPLACVLYFAITLFPALGYFNVYPMRYSFVADHFQHLATIGLTTLAAAGLSRCGRAGVVFSVILVSMLGCLTFTQCRVYANSETLWRDTLAKTPDSWMVYTNLGRTLALQGRALEAIPYLETALRLAPEIEDTHENVGVGRVLQGRYVEGESEFRRALAINPDFVPALTDLAKLEFFDLHHPTEAKAYFLKAIDRSADDAPAHYAYGQMLEREGNLAEAAGQYQAAVRAFPDDFDAEFNLGSVLLKLNRAGDAIVPLEAATRLEANNRGAWINLRAAYLMDNQPEAAGEAASEALRAGGGSGR
jgi:protein O-mannosyl-transferase